LRAHMVGGTKTPGWSRHWISVPLRSISISEIEGTHTRDPEHPLEGHRLLLFVDGKRPPSIY
ncbi:MAG TPA: hypothetical protein VL354_00635, partial [Spirochaetia bacterium]|nr:hypothetical protein [Spirochaetia bacterium]